MLLDDTFILEILVQVTHYRFHLNTVYNLTTYFGFLVKLTDVTGVTAYLFIIKL